MTTTTAPDTLVAKVRVRAASRPTPAFVRVDLSGQQLADLGDPGWDTRIKLVFPGPTGKLPALGDGASMLEDWFAAWMAMPEADRAPMRTYTIADVRRDGDEVVLVVDIAVHDGATGPACTWAQRAATGDELMVVVPHRASAGYGGTEFMPPESVEPLLLAGDETALPAIARILAGLDDDAVGEAFVEVPSLEDVREMPAPGGVRLTWLARAGEGYGRPLVAAVRRHLGLTGEVAGLADEELASSLDVDIWETPRFSSAGEPLAEPAREPADRTAAVSRAWIAGESWAVKVLRRSLVGELGVPRSRVAFMGYWREGVAMRS